MGSHIFGTFIFLKLNFKIPLLIPSPRGALVYERFLQLTFNKQGGDSYLNELVYAKIWQIISEVFVELLYSLGKCSPGSLVKLECAGNEIINSRAVSEVNIF